jgi:hypothetical protein
MALPVSSALWPWLTIAALGLFHGLNPSMGWLFAVALGLHRHSRKVVIASLVPIALGHALAIAAVVLAVFVLGIVVERGLLNYLAGATLLAWAGWHAIYGHRQRVRVGMQTGLAGLAFWSFLMASAHGAGLMLVPVLVPLCLSGAPGALNGASGSTALAAIALHASVMLAAIAFVSLLVYDYVGLAFLRSAWINLDAIWIAALAICGAVLFLV